MASKYLPMFVNNDLAYLIEFTGELPTTPLLISPLFLLLYILPLSLSLSLSRDYRNEKKARQKMPFCPTSWKWETTYWFRMMTQHFHLEIRSTRLFIEIYSFICVERFLWILSLQEWQFRKAVRIDRDGEMQAFQSTERISIFFDGSRNWFTVHKWLIGW